MSGGGSQQHKQCSKMQICGQKCGALWRRRWLRLWLRPLLLRPGIRQVTHALLMVVIGDAACQLITDHLLSLASDMCAICMQESLQDPLQPSSRRDRPRITGWPQLWRWLWASCCGRPASCGETAPPMC